MEAYFQTLHKLLPEPFFQTNGFLYFCGLTLALYWCIPRKWNEFRVAWLVVASWHFYAAWNAELAFLVFGTALADYAFARWMDRTTTPLWRKLILIASIGMNLGVLGYFKYRGFFLTELGRLFPELSPTSAANWLVPFGISFYTFEAISYAVDVYRRTIRAEKNPLHFLLFILFFPHLVAGPIVRAGDFLRQTRRVKRWNWLRVQVGVQFFVIGLFKKYAIADRLAVMADPVFANPEAFSSTANWLALFAFSIRIYADFSGYSDMALGVAHLFGYKLAKNFEQPYLSANIQDFWRRWHISLSTWLRDYLFIPLGGSRRGEWLTTRNLVIVMALGGLWHGAQWTYLLWGIYHGLLLVGYRRIGARGVGFKRWETNPLVHALSVAVTFVLVSLGWVFFRPEWAQSLTMLERLFAMAPGPNLAAKPVSLFWTALTLALAMMVMRWRSWPQMWLRVPPVLTGSALAFLVALALTMAPATEKVFIYFTF